MGYPKSIKITPIRLLVEKEGKSEGLACLASQPSDISFRIFAVTMMITG
jgi:hypothetical protein